MLDLQVANSARASKKVQGLRSLRAGDIVEEAVASFPFRGTRERDLVIVIVRRDFEFRGSRQALMNSMHNLIKNSLKAIHAKSAPLRQGDVLIEVGTFQDRGRIVVTDRGCGIEVAIQGRVFDPFFTTTPGDSHGLGLAYAKAVFQHAGGSIHIESESGQGTTVIAELPLSA
jgi:two-component system CAI-1 autoinducer sensor kinase/phosphatase CqsS